MPAKNPRFSFVIPSEVKADAEKLAEMERRTLSNFVLKLVRDEIDRAKQDGRLKDDANSHTAKDLL